MAKTTKLDTINKTKPILTLKKILKKKSARTTWVEHQHGTVEGIRAVPGEAQASEGASVAPPTKVVSAPWSG